MINDISKNVEEEKLRFQAVVGQLISLSQSRMGLGPFLQSFITGVVNLMKAEGGSIWVKRENRLELAFSTGNSEDMLPTDEEMTEEAMINRAMSDKEIYAVALRYPEAKVDNETCIGIYKPIVLEDEPFGVLKLVKKRDSNIIYQEEIGLLDAVAGLIPVYLNQMRLPKVLSRMEDIGKLFEVSKGIFSDLHIKKIAYSIANLLPSAVSCERCVVALKNKEAVKIEAITGQDMLEKKSVVVKNLTDIVKYVSIKGEALSLSFNTPADGFPEGLKAEAEEYFKNNPFKTFHAVPIKDDKKVLGVIAIETSKDMFTQNELMMFNFLAGQAALAFRNATMYHEIPYAGAWRKLSSAKDRFFALPVTKRALIAAVIVLGLLLLFVVKIPNKVSGECEVFPGVKYYARAKVEGILKSYLVREGDRVSAGQAVALMDDTEMLKKIREAQSRQEVLKAAMTKDFGAGRIADYEIERLRYMSIGAEIDLLRYSLENTRILAEGPGVVLTSQSRFTERIGKPLSKGEEIIEIGELGGLLLEVAVPEKDIRFIKSAQEISFILDAVQEGSFTTKVSSIREKAEPKQNGNYFIIEGRIEQPGFQIKPGMTGKAKIYADKKPVWYVYLRDIIDFLRIKVFF